MNDISAFAKCHPMEYCFEECTCTDCSNEWHLYDMMHNRPVKNIEMSVGSVGTQSNKLTTINEQICEKAESYPIPKAGIGAPALPQA